MKKMLMACLLVLLSRDAAQACVAFEGKYIPRAIGDAIGPEEALPVAEQIKLRDAATTFARAACVADETGLFVRVNVYAHPDGTSVELTTLTLAPARNAKLFAAIKRAFLQVSIRPGGKTVLLLLTPTGDVYASATRAAGEKTD